MSDEEKRDVLGKLNEKEVAAWYGRLADWTSKELKQKLGGIEPLSAQLLRHYLKGGGNLFKFSPPNYLKQSKYVKKQLGYHRSVYLTYKKARIGKPTMIGSWKAKNTPEKWAGIVPRLQGKSGYKKWDGQSALTLHYTANCEIPVEKTQTKGTAGDKDLLYGLHGFDLRTDVTVSGRPMKNSSLIEVHFANFTAKLLDYYDWSKIKGIKVPNPDYKSKAAHAVAPRARYIQVYHTNAIRIQDKGLAHPFKVESSKWAVKDQKVVGAATVNPNKTI